MCGLTGFWTPDRLPERLDAVARRMADTLTHREPDDAGVWVDEEVGLALGHRRLAILDLSPAEHQPMVSESSRYVIAFNGEKTAAIWRPDLTPGWGPPRGNSCIPTRVLMSLCALL